MPKPQKSQQVDVIVAMAIGTLLAVLIAWVLWSRIGITPRQIDTAERLAYAAKWCLVPGFALMLGIMMQANHRFFSPGINPLEGWPKHAEDDKWLVLWGRYTQNTLEQGVLFVIGVMAYSTITFQYWLKVIPIMAVLFAAGRILFIIGYAVRPTWRWTGFAMTFFPLIGLYGLTAYMFWFG